MQAEAKHQRINWSMKHPSASLLEQDNSENPQEPEYFRSNRTLRFPISNPPSTFFFTNQEEKE